MWTLDPWSIEEALFDWIVANIPAGSTILELGSGEGTWKLCEAGFKMFSVEHQASFTTLVPETTYIHASIKNDWYDAEALQGKLPNEYALLLVDGPDSDDRINMLNFLDLFNLKATIILDDYNHDPVKKLADDITRITGRNGLSVQGKTKQFWVIK
jgi:hypothetical protein